MLINTPEYDMMKGKLSIKSISGPIKRIHVIEYDKCNFVLSGDYLVVISRDKDSDKYISKHEIFPLNTITAYIRYM